LTGLSDSWETNRFRVAFSLSAIIPSFYAVHMSWLGAVMPDNATPAILLCLGGIIGAAMGPETKDVAF